MKDVVVVVWYVSFGIFSTLADATISGNTISNLKV